MTLGQRIAVFREGELQQVGQPLMVYREPANLFVAEFIGIPSINTVEGKIRREGTMNLFETAGLRLGLDRHVAGGGATLGIRPEALTLLPSGSPDGDFEASIRRLEPMGNEVHVHFQGPAESSWVARVDPESTLRVDDCVGVRLDRARTHLFNGPEMKRLAE
jgi:multiple sugar transport system ATP-binding protein